MKTVDFYKTIAASDLKGGRCRQLIEFMKVLKVKVISLPYIFQVLYVLCFTRPRYQVSVYRTIGPLVYNYSLNNAKKKWQSGKYRDGLADQTACFYTVELHLVPRI